MAKIEVRLKENYPNQFITTMAGDIIRHKEWTEVDDGNVEIQQFLNSGKEIEVKGAKEMREKVELTDDTGRGATESGPDKPVVLSAVPDGSESLREVVTPEKLKENQEVLHKKVAESKASEEEDEPAPESGDSF